jgi:hypothetical protein
LQANLGQAINFDKGGLSLPPLGELNRGMTAYEGTACHIGLPDNS